MRYRVRWYGYPHTADVWQPIETLPWLHVVRYHRRKKLRLLVNLVDSPVVSLIKMMDVKAIEP